MTPGPGPQPPTSRRDRGRQRLVEAWSYGNKKPALVRVRPEKQRRGGCYSNGLAFTLSSVPQLLLSNCGHFSSR